MTQTLAVKDQEALLVSALRGLAMDGPQQANSGHPGTAMACAPIGWTIYGRAMHHNPADPKWPNRDRFVLSCGHACILQYSLLHLCGYDVSREDLINFRQWGSKTPGHPELGHTPGIETTTGPLGQGIATATGMAIAERFLASQFNREGFDIVDHYTYVLASDGDMMEGISTETASLAGHLQLGKLIVFYDDNHITIEGDTELAFTENVDDKFRSLGWHVQRIGNDKANDLDALEKAIVEAKADARPSLISVRTLIAYPSPNMVNTSKSHGSPLGEAEIRLTKEKLGLPVDQKFYVPQETAELRKEILAKGSKQQQVWSDLLAKYAQKYPELHRLFLNQMAGKLPEGWDKDLPQFENGKAMATRVSSGEVIQALGKSLPNFIGGAADLAGSTMTLMKYESSQSKDDHGGRNMHFGIREHAMTAAVNGMEMHGGVIPFGSTFFVFTDYMRPSLRIAALSRIRSIFVLTHDSIGLGEDGPTHQAVEHLASLRAMPHLTEIRPCDAHEVREAWKAAILHEGGPVLLVLSRQNCPTLQPASRYGSPEGVAKGAYVISEGKDPNKLDGILIASGYEVHPCLDAQLLLEQEGLSVRVVSMPSWALFAKQDKSYRDQILPPSVRRRLSVEAGSTFGWERYTTEDGASHGLDRFGASAPWETNMEKFGFTGPHLADHFKKLI